LRLKDPGEPREASQPALSKRSAPKGSLRRINRAFGSLPYKCSAQLLEQEFKEGRS